MSTPILVLDFDGTVCLGDGPVWAYANNVLPHLGRDVAASVTSALVRYLNGDADQAGYADGYAAVAELAGPHTTQQVLSAAYLESRAALEDPETDIRAPRGFPEFLAAAHAQQHVVLFTNAPDTGLTVALERLGIARHVDEVISSGHKPQHSTQTLSDLLDGAPAHMLMSVGDLWSNDIEPALRLGCATAFVDHSGQDARPSHIKARQLPDMYDDLQDWATDPQAFMTDRALSTGELSI